MPSDLRGWRQQAVVGLMTLAGCEAQDPAQGASRMQLVESNLGEDAVDTEIAQKIAAVTKMLTALDSSVDRDEAARAARIAVQEPLIWARDWRVEDPPLLHNFKVVNGLRDKGVCQDFADAMHAALSAEGFQTLQIHRAVGNLRSPLLEHATVILSARGQSMEQGVILDPWRIGQGQLWFSRVTEDKKYDWETLESARAWRTQGLGGS